MRFLIIIFLLSLFNFAGFAKDLHVFGLGLYDIKFGGGSTNQATDFRC